ncbi:MAG: MBL fold metallo-hydrolase [Alphaproteobacteria bacterium]|nr:MBL fold metallo-hydrolase [Alphaproteobacteria bacterium]
MLRIIGRILSGIGTILLFAVIALCLAIALVPPFLDRIYYTGSMSGHYDGQHFFNPDGIDDLASPQPGRSRSSFVARWLLGADDRPAWPEKVTVTPSRPQITVPPGQMRATWVGHATVLIQVEGLNILTDPIWSDHASPFPPLGPKRVTAPGIGFDDLPKIDLVVVSHNHYDHMDLPTLKRLWERDRPLIVTSLGNDTLIAGAGVTSRALDWGQSITVQPGVRVHVTRNHHWSSRWGTDRNRAFWSSFTIETPAGNIFFAGDTGAGDMKWPVEARRYGPIRLALIPIGAFRFYAGQMSTSTHVGPREAVDIFDGLKASYAIPIHWATFRLSYEAYDTPPRMLDLFMRCAGLNPRRFGRQDIGRPITVPMYSASEKTAPSIDPAICRDGSKALRILQ